jgi:hypothetical protein
MGGADSGGETFSRPTRGVVSDESATGNGLIPSAASMMSSLLGGRRIPSKPTGALSLLGYYRFPMAFRRRFMTLEKWLRL